MKDTIEGICQTINQPLKKRSRTTNIKDLCVKGVDVFRNDGIANLMTDWLCSIGKDLAKDIPDILNSLINGKCMVNTVSVFKKFYPLT